VLSAAGEKIAEGAPADFAADPPSSTRTSARSPPARNVLELHGVEAGYGEARAIDGRQSVRRPRRDRRAPRARRRRQEHAAERRRRARAPPRRPRSAGDGQDLAPRARAQTSWRTGFASCPKAGRLFVGMTVEENLELGAFAPRARAAAPAPSSASSRCSRSRERRRQIGPRALGRPAADGRRRPRADELAAAAHAGRAVARHRAAARRRDPRGAGEINRAGVSIFLVEQNVPAALYLAHRAYVMEGGRIVREGSRRRSACRIRTCAARTWARCVRA
jgi:branched-chain amino acid transport system ATP-binding protein